MARKKMTQDEQKEWLRFQLSKAQEGLKAAEKRMGDNEKIREKLIAKVKEKKIEVEKYQALARDTQYSVLEETLRTKGVNIEEVTKAIANGDMKFLMELTELKADNDEQKDKNEQRPQSAAAELNQPALAYTDKTNFPIQTVNLKPPSITEGAANIEKTPKLVEEIKQTVQQHRTDEAEHNGMINPPATNNQQQKNTYANAYRADLPAAAMNGQPARQQQKNQYTEQQRAAMTAQTANRQPVREKNADAWQYVPPAVKQS